VVPARLGAPKTSAPANVTALSAQSPPAFVMTLRIDTSGIARLHNGTIVRGDAVNVEDRRTGCLAPFCALR
jgi:hypothetical protein